MKKVLIGGASGMIGGVVLQQSLQSNEVSEVISLVRRASGVTHPKLKEVEVNDFSDLSNYSEYFKGLDAVYFCIGVYTGAVKDDLFKIITVDYTIAFVDQLKMHSPNARFCLLSGAGADRKEKSRMSFARYKGMAENYMFDQLESAYSFRPAYIYPVVKRNEPNVSYRISRSLYPLIKLFGSNMSVKSTELGTAIFKAGLKGAPQPILENRDILNYLND